MLMPSVPVPVLHAMPAGQGQSLFQPGRSPVQIEK